MRFTNASEYLKGNIQTCVDGPALIAKVLDSIEGNMYFHSHISKWLIDKKSFVRKDNGPRTRIHI
ncbi:hypothetical protein LDC_1845 [sediment metagenome]|uniref:Uncharacterized protein n=1 Tax=sediment metagenome TaxID=749907 RepID=D9PJY2_9ZZZZ